MNNIFEIKNLQCEYIPGTPALQIDRLEIPRSKLIFVIGKSGMGKSTFIETLGLMNKTIANLPDTSVIFSPTEEKRLEMKDSWGLTNDKLSEFRSSYFSFIFQNTNLMPNFSSGENMMVSLLIEGRPYAEAKDEVLKVMERLSLDRNLFDKRVTEISGGQRQRLAFVRAITANFTVLFGDEPTGNLDRNTSLELMSIFKELIIQKGKTGIIVSHDLTLADKFADIIIPITNRELSTGDRCGSVEPRNVIFRKDDNRWETAYGEQLLDTEAYLNYFLSN